MPHGFAVYNELPGDNSERYRARREQEEKNAKIAFELLDQLGYKLVSYGSKRRYEKRHDDFHIALLIYERSGFWFFETSKIILSVGTTFTFEGLVGDVDVMFNDKSADQTDSREAIATYFKALKPFLTSYAKLKFS